MIFRKGGEIPLTTRMSFLDRAPKKYSAVDEIKKDLRNRLIALAVIAVIGIYGRTATDMQRIDDKYFEGKMMGDVGRGLAQTGIIAGADNIRVVSDRRGLFSSPQIVVLSSGRYEERPPE